MTVSLDALTNLALGMGIDLVGGNFDGLKEMNTKSLLKLHEEKAQDIDRVTQTIPTISLASQFENPGFLFLGLTPTHKRSAFEILNRFILLSGGGPNDGMTPLASACLKGSDCVYLKNLDHGNLAVDLSPFSALKKEMKK